MRTAMPGLSRSALILTVALATGRATAQPAPEDQLARPSPQQAAWQDLEVGMFIHIAPQTWQDRESDNLSTPLSAINPTKLDTDQWVNVARSMGARYIVFVAKHEGGFCWWPTGTTEHCIRNIPWRDGKGDVLADLSKSCRRQGIKLGVYLSPQDRTHGVGVGGRAKDPARQPEYEKLFRAQLTEVLTRYGEMVEVWFDGSLVFDVGDILAAHAPHAMVFQGPQATIRWVGNEDGIAPDPAWNAVAHPKPGLKWGEYTAADGDPAGNRWLPNECDARIRATWFWRSDNAGTLKSLDQLTAMYEQSVGRGATLLLNNTPDTSGLIPAQDAARSAELGERIRMQYEHAAADTSGTARELTISLSAPTTIDRAVIMEDIRQGERIRRFVLEADQDGAWVAIASGTAVGHKRISTFQPIRTSQIRLRTLDSVGTPVIRRFAVHRPIDAGAQMDPTRPSGTPPEP
ncbi:MAG: alpha-L-fucosidase [Phycisphaerales bacterium]|nr:alpha-L-fucosidase [Phycisphaerales bacterium]